MAYCKLGYVKHFRNIDFEINQWETEKLDQEHRKRAKRNLPPADGFTEPEDWDEFAVAEKINGNLHGHMKHTRLLLALQYHLYDELQASIVERNNYDLLDRENQILGEVGRVNGKKNVSTGKPWFKERVMEFLLRKDLEDREDWRFYWLPYESNVIYECQITEKTIRKIKDNLETGFKDEADHE